MAEWGQCRKLTLYTSKCEVAFFTYNSKEARWQPAVQLDGTTLTTTSLPKIHGVTIDKAPSFVPHVAAVVSKASNRCRVLASLTSITGQLKTTPLEALRIEAGVPSIATQAQQQAAVAHRLPTNHPRRTLLDEPCRHRLKRPSWRSTAKALTSR